MAYNWIGGPLSGIGAGLMAAGAGGWQQFAPAMAVGQQQYDQGQQAQQENEYRKLLADATRQKMEDDRAANERAAQQQTQYQNLISGLDGGMLGPNNGRPGGMAQPNIGPGLLGGVQIPKPILSMAASMQPDEGMKFLTPWFKPQEADKAPASVQEYEYDVKNGYNGPYHQWLLEKGASTANKVSVTNAPMVLGDKDASGIVRGTLEGWQKQGQAASEAFANLQQVRASLDNGLQTGALASPREYVAKALVALGADESSVDGVFKLSDAKLFTSATKGLVLAQIKSLGANPSNADVKFLEATLPHINDSPEAAKAVTDWLSDKYEDQMDKFQMGYSVFKSGKDPVEWDSKMTRYWAVPRKDRQNLLAHPEDKEAFDSVYGKGAADLILSVGQ